MSPHLCHLCLCPCPACPSTADDSVMVHGMLLCPAELDELVLIVDLEAEHCWIVNYFLHACYGLNKF